MIYLQGKGKEEKRKKKLEGRINNQIVGVKRLRMGVWVERNFIFSSQVCVMYYTTLLRNIVEKKCKGACLVPKGNVDSFQGTVLDLSISGKSKKHHGKEKPLRGFD